MIVKVSGQGEAVPIMKNLLEQAEILTKRGPFDFEIELNTVPKAKVLLFDSIGGELKEKIFKYVRELITIPILIYPSKVIRNEGYLSIQVPFDEIRSVCIGILRGIMWKANMPSPVVTKTGMITTKPWWKKWLL